MPGEDKGELRVFKSEEDMEELAAMSLDKIEHELRITEENLAAQHPDLKVTTTLFSCPLQS